ncbi:response regulator [Sphingobium sp. H33]|uniref:histidine kinase n=2 Tax=Sphingobium nicotianae TaxID=2782607 RepID=A0A9X1IRC4_9SPHN|nr:response regulator [Sphingobium nicotianae]
MRVGSPVRPASLKAWIKQLMATPLAAAIIALLLLLAGVVFTLQVDRIGRTEKLRQASVQAQILASGIAAPLAFGDEATLREYLEALRADPQIIAVGAYDATGRFVAGYNVVPTRLPDHGRLAEPAMTARDLTVTAAVVQGGTRLGTVYLRATLDSWQRRATRYAGLAAIVLMASLLIATLGASYASLHEAHARLQEETASRQQAEEALRQSQKMEALGQLTGGVAHDFNNLLMVASGSLDLMDRTDDPARLDRLKAGIRHAVDRGAKLTQQLLAFSRRSPLKAEVVDLGDRIRGMDTLLDRLTTNGISLKTSIASNLWPVEIDPSELEVALLNVVINARDAMPQGGLVTISAENLPGDGGAPDQVRIAISDTGTGIPPDVLDRIFEPFFTTKGAGHGTGLGLSQVYGFVRASGGDIQVESVPGQGTRITLLLPRSTLSPIRSQPEQPVVEAASKRRILLVEDNDTVAEMVGGMLDEIGYEQERAASGDEALVRLEQGANFALVLSDMIMPGKLNGLDLVHEIGRRWPRMPAVLMTGFSEASISARGEGIPLLTKPFSIQSLSAQINDTLSRS